MITRENSQRVRLALTDARLKILDAVDWLDQADFDRDRIAELDAILRQLHTIRVAVRDAEGTDQS